MLSLQSYYDGTAVQTLEKITAKKNQKLIITILDEFIEETPKKSGISARGSLAKYANTALWEEGQPTHLPVICSIPSSLQEKL